MTGAMRFVCSDPDAGDFEFADVEAVLDALEAALVQPATPLFDRVRQSWQPAGLHPEIRAAWEARLRYRPPAAAGCALPELPSMTALARSLPDDADERERAGTAFARMRAALPAEVRHAATTTGAAVRRARRRVGARAAGGGRVGVVVTFAARLSRARGRGRRGTAAEMSRCALASASGISADGRSFGRIRPHPRPPVPARPSPA